MDKKLMMATAAMTAVMGSSADAQNRWPKWYIGLHGVVPFVDEADTSVSGVGAGDLSFESGFGGGVSLGYKPGGTGTVFDSTRFEVEYSYRDNDLDTLGSASIRDNMTANAAMFNAYYDVETASNWLPYLGGGVGIADVELNIPTLGLDDEDDSVFAWQLMAGLGYAPELMPNTVFSLGYRYFATSDPEFSGATSIVETEYGVHNLEAGARFSF